MKELGVNTIRVYHVDATAKHDGCMKALDDAGIYVLIDLDTFDTYIEAVSTSWTWTDKISEFVSRLSNNHVEGSLLELYPV